MCWILKRLSVIVMRLYSSHLVTPQTRSPFLKSGCPDSKTLATPYPTIGYMFQQKKKKRFICECKLNYDKNSLYFKLNQVYLVSRQARELYYRLLSNPYKVNRKERKHISKRERERERAMSKSLLNEEQRNKKGNLGF